MIKIIEQFLGYKQFEKNKYQCLVSLIWPVAFDSQNLSAAVHFITYLHDYLPKLYCIYTLDWILKESFNGGKDLDRKVGCSKVKDQIGVDKDSKTFQESGKIAGKMWIRLSKI